MVQEDKITVHWLNFSRAQRILWLLDELNLSYDLKVYQRTKEYRAPKELDKVHPLGKSPVVEITKPDGEVIQLAESGWIVQYLIDNYDTEGKIKPANVKDSNQVNYFLHYSEGTLQPLLVGLLVNQMATKVPPFPANYIAGAVVKGINAKYYGPELEKNLKYLNGIAAAQEAKGSKYLVGNKLSGADIILSFPIISIFTTGRGLRPTVVEDFPELHKYYQNLTQEKKLKDVNEKIAQYEKNSPLKL
ncbi:hypothetical protein I9W82_001289 [Candida metapsilosis]|uniref:glutathione transferase n=1 Tax=Candida metapsilosis TaxID=273372 RepID=A0A8H8DDP8_9ASCO|nr:hypothetical protein I9W82_001289 [Candida metapsilosis]